MMQKKVTVHLIVCRSSKSSVLLREGRDDMYRLNDIREIDSIIQKVLDSDFDRVGHSMYSAGLKNTKHSC